MLMLQVTVQDRRITPPVKGSRSKLIVFEWACGNGVYPVPATHPPSKPLRHQSYHQLSTVKTQTTRTNTYTNLTQRLCRSLRYACSAIPSKWIRWPLKSATKDETIPAWKNGKNFC